MFFLIIQVISLAILQQYVDNPMNNLIIIIYVIYIDLYIYIYIYIYI
jgi:hypothetical protein